MSGFVCGHCFIDYENKADLNKHFEKVIATKERRKLSRVIGKFTPILVAVFNAGFESGTGYLMVGQKKMSRGEALEEIAKILEGRLK